MLLFCIDLSLKKAKKTRTMLDDGMRERERENVLWTYALSFLKLKFEISHIMTNIVSHNQQFEIVDEK